MTFGNLAVFGQGGGEIGVYDVNGDKLADVVTGSAHNWGLKWFEQKRAADSTQTFEQHMIAQDFSTTNAGGVVFSESHAARFEDMDGDKIPDFVTGKRMWSELENYTAQDPYGAACALHLPDGSRREGSGWRAIRARAGAQPVRRGIVVRHRGPQP